MNYTLGRVKNHADSETSLPANNLDPDAEWGYSRQDVRHRLQGTVNVPLVLGLRANVNINAQSATPYTITTGRDDNGDGTSNDRPAGVGRNTERGTATFVTNLRVSRAFALGGQRTGGGFPGGGGRPGGPGGGGFGPGGPAWWRRRIGRSDTPTRRAKAAAPWRWRRPRRQSGRRRVQCALHDGALRHRRQRLQPRELRRIQRQPAVRLLRTADDGAAPAAGAGRDAVPVLDPSPVSQSPVPGHEQEPRTRRRPETGDRRRGTAI